MLTQHFNILTLEDLDKLLFLLLDSIKPSQGSGGLVLKEGVLYEEDVITFQ